MADQFVVAELLVRKHIRKYLLRKLDPATAPTTPYAEEINRSIAELLTLRLLVDADTAPADPASTDPEKPVSSSKKLSLKVSTGFATDLPLATHSMILDMVESVYRREFHHEVDMLHLTFSVPLQDAIQLFRSQYGITEDDYPLRNSEKCYHRHFRRRYPSMVGKRPRGRPLKPLAALSESYRKRLLHTGDRHGQQPETEL